MATNGEKQEADRDSRSASEVKQPASSLSTQDELHSPEFGEATGDPVDALPPPREAAPPDTHTPRGGPDETIDLRDSDSTTPSSLVSPDGARPIPVAEGVFRRGDRVANRYQIIRFIAHGGVGEVYEALDLELNLRVALKTIRPEQTETPKIAERFRREIQLARKVTHHNVCRIFDFGRHQAVRQGAAEARSILFLTMEYLEGETLSHRLRRNGALAPAEALPLVRQMVKALQAAHAVGVIHRDFKSSNIMLVPSADGQSVPRLVVTDFGLARAASGKDSGASFTGTGGIVGTPLYMAPEQVEGQPTTPVTDLFALGVVMFEMVTGHFPFTGESALSTAVRRLREKAPSPRIYTRDLDRQWEKTILRCLEKNPHNRFARAEDVTRALEGDSVRPPWPVIRWRLLVATLVILVGAGIWKSADTWLRTKSATETSASSTTRRTLALFGFKNLSGRPESDWISTALSEMLAMEISAAKDLRAVPGETVARAKLELELPEADAYALDTLVRIGKNLGAELVVLGSYLASRPEAGGRVRLNLRVQSTRTGESVVLVSLDGTEAGLLDLVSEAGNKLRRVLGVGTISPAEAAAIRLAFPSDAEATKLYAQGLKRLRHSDALEARDLLEKSVAADPGNALAHAALAEAWAALGQSRRSEKEARLAYELSSQLIGHQRLWVEARYREAAGNWNEAEELYRMLWQTFPDDLEYGLHLANVQIASGNGPKALQTIHTIQEQAGKGHADPRLDLAAARAYYAKGDFERQRQAAAKAVRKGLAIEAQLLVAQARRLEGLALLPLGQPMQALESLKKAKEIADAAGDRQLAAQATEDMARVHWNHGDLRKALALSRQALGTFQEEQNIRSMTSALTLISSCLDRLGQTQEATAAAKKSLRLAEKLDDLAAVIRAQNNLAEFSLWQGKLSEAESRYRKILELSRKIGSKTGRAAALLNMAIVALERGQPRRGTEIAQQALEAFTAMQFQRGIAWCLSELGRAALDQGQLKEAQEKLHQAFRLCRVYDLRHTIGYVLNNLGRLALVQGDLETAERRFQEALKEDRTPEVNAAASQLGLAKVYLELGDLEKSRALAKKSLATFQKRASPGQQALAQVILARSFLALGDLAQAAAHSNRAQALAKGLETRGVSFDVELLNLRLQAAKTNARSRTGQIRRRLEKLEKRAKEAHLAKFRFAAAIELARLAMTAGESARGLEILEKIDREARALGMGLVSRWVDELRNGK